MKKKNTRAIVLRAGLSLSMLFGVALNTERASAEVSEKEDTSIEVIPNVEDSFEKNSFENVEEQESVIEAEAEQEEIVEETEYLPKDKVEESEDSENLHIDDQSEDEDAETSEQLVDETESEEITDDEVDTLEGEAKPAEIESIEEELDKIEETSEMETSVDSDLAPASMTMSAQSNNSDEAVKVDRVYGENRFSNAVEISKKGWSTAPKVFLANGYKFADSLTGSPLAALNNAPILLTRDYTLPEVTLAELKRLNTKEVVILGGELSVPKHIVNTLEQNGFKVTRLGGNNRYTQAELVANEIMKFEGKNRDAFLASGEVFSDALSVATIASNKRLPIYLTRGNRLEQSVRTAIPNVNSWTIIGGRLTINESVENEMKKAGAKVQRINGKNRYEVNRNVLNRYGVPEEHLYVTSGEHYSDTLPASVLASKENSGVLLLRDKNKKTNDEQKIFAQNKHKIRDYTIIGGPSTISKETETDFGNLIRTVNDDMMEAIKRQFSGYTFSHYNLTLQDALDMQMIVTPQTDKKYTAFVSKDYINGNNNTVTADILNVRSGAGSNHHAIAQLKKGTKVDIINESGNWYQINLKQYWLNANPNDVNYYLNPNNFILSDAQKFQFLDLTRTTGATAAQLNKVLKGKGILEGTGQAFIDAGNKHGVNEVYLLSHALLETGHGTSKLAKGIQINGHKAYNMFGIGAYDSDPVKHGSRRAYEEKWYTPEEAIVGGAAFIGNNYIKAGQNTLYKMRWNPESMHTHGYSSHQYATDIGWASKQVGTIYNLYKSIGIDLRHINIPVYLA